MLVFEAKLILILIFHLLYIIIFLNNRLPNAFLNIHTFAPFLLMEYKKAGEFKFSGHFVVVEKLFENETYRNLEPNIHRLTLLTSG